ncbi:MAG: hypothetical protein RQ735_05500 [Flavobacteriaceae bacterium]|nr:hypothetical protein [Flavobacteriaceae bacterium]
MKTNKFFSALTVLFLLVFMASCTSDNALIGPPGADGIDGVDGVDGTASCLACHNTQHRDSITDAYLLSSHGSGTTFARGNSVSCARCHSNEGFVEVMETGLAEPRVAPEFPTRITCTTCHSDHDTFDFERDGQDFALRFKEDQVPLMVTDPSIMVSWNDSSNLCVNCHQPRELKPEDDGDGIFTITSSRFGPHHGPQSMTLEGIQGVEIPGSMPYPNPGSNPHKSLSSCVECHMGPAGDEVGIHTMKPNIVTCQQCHPGATDFNINGVRTEIEDLITQLETRLIDRGIMNPDNGRNFTGDFPINLVSAYWNRIYLVEDQTLGVHNYEYAKALLVNTIEYLDNNPAPN